MWTEAVSRKKKLRIQKYPYTCGRDLKLPNKEFKALSPLRRRNLKTVVALCKYIKCLPSTLRRKNHLDCNNHQSIWILCLRKTRAGKINMINVINMIIVTESCGRNPNRRKKLRLQIYLTWCGRRLRARRFTRYDFAACEKPYDRPTT